MAMRSRQADDSKIKGALARWCREADSRDKRTLVLRTVASLDPETARDELTDHGVDVITVGVGTVVIGVTPSALSEIAVLDWILSVEEPSELNQISR